MTIVDPSNAEAFNNLGIAYRNNEELEKAAAAYGRAVGINPSFAEAHNNLGLVFYFLGYWY